MTARASHPVIHRLKADALVELSHAAAGETVWGVYSPELDRQLQELGNLNEETGEYCGYRDDSDADEDRWSVRLHIERTAEQEREHYANVDRSEEIAARASRSGTRWTDSDRHDRGQKRLQIWLDEQLIDRLDEMAEELGESRTEALSSILRAEHREFTSSRERWTKRLEG